MEDTLVASYLALIIGYLIHEDKDHEKIVRQWMPENNFSQMVAVLKKFFNFMNLTASVSIPIWYYKWDIILQTIKGKLKAGG